LTMSGGGLDVKPVLGTPAERIIQAVAKGGPELVAFAKTALDANGTDRGNKGCYGANLYYDFLVENTGNQSYPLYAYGVARNVSDTFNPLGYFGPLRIHSPGSYGARSVVRFRCDTSFPGDGDVVRLTTSDGLAESPASVNPGSVTYRIAAAVAGSASAPFNIALRGIAYQLLEPPQ
jgi:hypothetical protein